jgi:hypothetical protein
VKPIHIFCACSENSNEKIRIRFLSFDLIMMEFAPYLDHEGIHHEMIMPHIHLNKMLS